MRTSNEMQIGKAGEHLVCADLILKGYVAFLSDQGLPYDVLLDTGKKVLRIQVKTTNGVRIVQQRAKEQKAYVFNIKKHGKGNLQRYGIGEVDIFALVCLDTMKIGYLKTDDMPETINIRADSLKGTYYDEKGISDYEKVIALKGKMSHIRIGKEVGISNTTVGRMLKPGYSPFQTNARYFSDFEKDAGWFNGI